jgi:hypothetical protein
VNTTNIILKILSENPLQAELFVDKQTIDRCITLWESYSKRYEHLILEHIDKIFTIQTEYLPQMMVGWWKYSLTAPLNPVYILPSLKHFGEMNLVGQAIALGDLFIAHERCILALPKVLQPTDS